MKVLEERAATFTDYEQLLGAAPQGTEEESGHFEFAEALKTRRLFDDKLKLWEVTAQWQEMAHNWNVSEFVKERDVLRSKRKSVSGCDVYAICYRYVYDLCIDIDVGCT